MCMEMFNYKRKIDLTFRQMDKQLRRFTLSIDDVDILFKKLNASKTTIGRKRIGTEII